MYTKARLVDRYFRRLLTYICDECRLASQHVFPAEDQEFGWSADPGQNSLLVVERPVIKTGEYQDVSVEPVSPGSS